MPRNSKLSGPISLRLPVEVLASVEEIAKATERTRSWIVVRALKRYLATEGKEILDFVEGRAQVEAGESYDMEEVLQEVERIVRSSPGKAA